MTPTSVLAYSTTYTATLSGVTDMVGDPMSSPFSWSFTTVAPAPAVTNETPSSSATSIATNSTVAATFNEALLASTVNSTDFVLKSSSGSTIAATVSYNSSNFTATLTPTALLANATTYTATLNGISSSTGVAMASAFSWSFTTGPAPAVTTETPAANAANVAIGTALSATFNEPVQASTVNSTDFLLKASSGSSIAATVTYNSSTNTATLTPTSALANSTTYTATISGVTDTVGDPMSSPFSWSFTTVAPAPAVTNETPSSSATSIATNSTVAATFNEALLASTVNSTDFVLKSSSGSTIAATVSYNSSNFTATLTPTALLANATTYTATLNGISSSTGVAMASAFSWSFTTGPAPAVTTETPAANAANVAIGTALSATFNEPVQASTVNSTDFLLKTSSGSSIAATVTYNSSTNTATLTPTSVLSYSTTYTATLSGVTDMVGDPMSSPFFSSFSTVAPAPTVMSESPASAATKVATNSTISAAFNQALLATSVNTTDFVLRSASGSTVAATVSYNPSNFTVTLAPLSLLSNSTTYTATLSGISNSSGIAMASPFSWSFKTGPAPTVVRHTPASAANGVAVSSAITATFNEAVQFNTINYTFLSSSGTSVAAKASYNSANFTMTLTPTSPLAYNTKYTVAIIQAWDTAGDWMAAPSSWSFTTDVAPPSIKATSPANGATNVPITTTVSATFNEAVQSGTIKFTLKTSTGTTVAASVVYNSANFTVTLTPSHSLASYTKYIATISGVKDTAGDPMSAPFSWSFTTGGSGINSDAVAGSGSGSGSDLNSIGRKNTPRNHSLKQNLQPFSPFGTGSDLAIRNYGGASSDGVNPASTTKNDPQSDAIASMAPKTPFGLVSEALLTEIARDRLRVNQTKLFVDA